MAGKRDRHAPSYPSNGSVEEALSRSRSIGTFWAISVQLPDPQIIDLLTRAGGRLGALDK